MPKRVIADERRLSQILSILVDNALKFTSRGRVSVKVRYAEVNQELTFEVEDTGTGIASDRLETMFLPFSRSDSSSTRRGGGTGMGLTIARRLCEGMGGTVLATSEEGQGSVFSATVRAPRPESESEASSAVADDGECAPAVVTQPVSTGNEPVEERGLHGLRVLVVEDNPVNQKIAKAMLKRLECAVEVVENGALAVDRVSAGPPDIILMDLDMPVMDGLTATRAIRSAGLQAVPIVAVTANAVMGDRGVCLEAGMDDYLAKPYSKDGLRSALVRWCRGREGARQG